MYVCDSSSDCVDRSDEENCGSKCAVLKAGKERNEGIDRGRGSWRKCLGRDECMGEVPGLIVAVVMPNPLELKEACSS